MLRNWLTLILGNSKFKICRVGQWAGKQARTDAAVLSLKFVGQFGRLETWAGYLKRSTEA